MALNLNWDDDTLGDMAQHSKASNGRDSASFTFQNDWATHAFVCATANGIVKMGFYFS